MDFLNCRQRQGQVTRTIVIEEKSEESSRAPKPTTTQKCLPQTITTITMITIVVRMPSTFKTSTFALFAGVSLVSFVRGIVAVSDSPFGNGINLQPSYYNSGNPNFAWDLMESYSSVIRTVRIEIEPSVTQNALGWIQAAQNAGFHVVATYHDYTKLGSDDPSDLITAANWWIDNYEKLSSAYTANFTVNLMNEWGSHSLSSGDYASGYNAAVALVRKVYDGNIILDIPGWGQEPQVAAGASALIHDPKIIFSAHVYPTAWNGHENRYFNANDLSSLAETGRSCIIGEFGTKGSGYADVSSIVSAAKGLGWAVLGWAWNGDGTGMNMVEPAWSSNPTASSFTIDSSYFYEVYNLIK